MTLCEMQKIRRQSFFSKRLKSIYELPCFKLKKTTYFVRADPYLVLNTEKPVFSENTENPNLFRK